MRTFLVTGGAGFIGSNIAEALVKRGDRVRVLDNFSTGNHANLAGIRGRIELIEGDILDLAAVTRAVAGVDTVFHQAAMASVQWSVERRLDSHAACCTGTVNVLEAARRSGVRRVVYAGSSAAYGDQPTASKRESDLPAPDFALCRRQARRRAVLSGVLRHLRPGDGRAAVFQRFWAAARPRQPLFGRDSAVHYRDARRPATGRVWRRPAVARLQLRGQRGPGEPAGGRRPGRRRPGY